MSGVNTNVGVGAYHSLLPDPTQREQVRNLLRSHSPPPAHLTSNVSALAKAVLHYESEIPRLRAELAKAEADYIALKDHSAAVRSLLAPIRRLPSEILVHIFDQCEHPIRNPPDPVSNAYMLAGELADVARKPLLTVSQVCSRWHDIVVGTPTFWNTIRVYGLWLWRTRMSSRKTTNLMKFALDRSGNTPLTFRIVLSFADSDNYCTPALKLLAEHCERWKTVHLCCRPSQIPDLRGIKGKLPLLETLELEVDDPRPAAVRDLFQTAPRLKTFLIGGRLPPALAALHIPQLQTAGCLSQQPDQVPAAVSFMSSLPSQVEYRLQLFLGHWRHNKVTGIDLPPTSSNIATLSMETCDYFKRPHCVKAFSDIFASLTLPHLRDLKFRSRDAPYSLISWAHPAFLDFSARSSFHDHLHSLSLFDVIVTETELIEALFSLPSLHHLEISDHSIVAGHSVDELLITDTLLSALTLRPELNPPGLVPLLNTLHCRSVLRFDDHRYLDFLLSRRREPASNSAPFVCRIHWISGHLRALDVGVNARLRDLCARKELNCEFS
ncbi:hypothetical protein DFH06DRAFT_1188302 [Mycena polygramma]|nr:hypothetical protein DFH06DRAFT_1188302 [Mycena polygramma]